MKTVAIMDIGTNSIKFYLAAVEGGQVDVIADTNNIVRLGEGLQQTGTISPAAMDRNLQAMSEFKSIALENRAEEIIAVGTMCLRKAANAIEFINRARDELGLVIQVIPGEEEARLSYMAVLSTVGSGVGNVVVFDTGGGSTEFIFGQGKDIEKRFSLDIGAVEPTERFLKSDPVTDRELNNMLSFIKEYLVDHGVEGSPEHLIGIGGTVTTMGAVKHEMVHYDPEIIQGSRLDRGEIARQIELYSGKTIQERTKITGLQPKRADVILAGAGILKSILEIFGREYLTVSDRGLRHGLLFDRYLS